MIVLKVHRRTPQRTAALNASRSRLREFLAADPHLGGVNVQQLANRLHARGLRAPKAVRR